MVGSVACYRMTSNGRVKKYVDRCMVVRQTRNRKMLGGKIGPAVDRHGVSRNGIVPMSGTRSPTLLCGGVVMWNVELENGCSISHNSMQNCNVVSRK